MHRKQIVPSVLIPAAFTALAALAGCSRSEAPPTVAESISQAAQPTNQAVTVTGCLKAGSAENTFVLATARTAGSQDAATYHLDGGDAANLRDHVGERVEVSGTVNAQQETVSRRTAVAPEEDRPAGTSGTPRVETKTELDIRRLAVSAIKPLAEKCDM
jgi:hypothetical protein